MLGHSESYFTNYLIMCAYVWLAMNKTKCPTMSTNTLQNITYCNQIKDCLRVY